MSIAFIFLGACHEVKSFIIYGLGFLLHGTVLFATSPRLRASACGLFASITGAESRFYTNINNTLKNGQTKKIPVFVPKLFS
jgi:hypothetical protein